MVGLLPAGYWKNRCPYCAEENWKPHAPACPVVTLGPAPAPTGWQRIETAPWHEKVLLYAPPEKLSNDPDQEHEIRVGTRASYCWATHWMALPKPP